MNFTRKWVFFYVHCFHVSFLWLPFPPPPPPPQSPQKHSRTSSESLEASVSLSNPWTQPSRASFYFNQELSLLSSLIAFHHCKASCVISKITIARSVEENAFFFLLPFFFRLSFVCRAKYQGRMYLCPGGLISQVIISTKYLIQRNFKRLLQSETICYYKVRQLNLLQSATTCYYKVWQLFYYKVRQVLLQSAIGITKCNSFITKCDDYYKVRQNKHRWYYGQKSREWMKFLKNVKIPEVTAEQNRQNGWNFLVLVVLNFIVEGTHS